MNRSIVRSLLSVSLLAAPFAIALSAGCAAPVQSGTDQGSEADIRSAHKICGGIAGLTCPASQECVDDPTDSCDPAHGGADCSGTCQPKPAPAKICGGFAGIACPANEICVDDPTDSCDPAHGGADCSGTCQPKPAPKACGGFAGIACPANEICVDDPTDSCDPAHGGADCGGICQPKKK